MIDIYNMSDFYRHIYKKGDNYELIKNGTVYGYYDDIRVALYERDLLEQLDWDYDAFVDYDVEIPNSYLHMELPPFEHKPKNIIQLGGEYCVHDKGSVVASFKKEEHAIEFRNHHGGVVKQKTKKYRIRKMINRKLQYFGTFDSLEEAMTVRDDLIENNWSFKEE